MKKKDNEQAKLSPRPSFDLLDCALEFRQGILENGSSPRMCFAVCAPLQGFLSAIYNFETELTEGAIGEHQHYWLTLPDGQIIDPTADQFPNPTGEPMPEVFIGTRPDWYVEAI
jgi:hypothetical protein